MLLAFAMFAAAAPALVVVQPVANLYSAPTMDADVVSQAIYATPVEQVDTAEGWIRIRTLDDYLGWVPETSLHRRDTPYPGEGRSLWVDSLFVNLYREPDVTTFQPVITLPYNTRLAVVDEPEPDGRWIQVRLPDDRTAWLQRGDVRFDDNPLSVPAAIALAKRFQGLPYLWGGTSSFGFDCSGLTQLLSERRGISIPRDSGPQFRWKNATPVKLGDVQPGDLLFFGESADHITHTGMYIGSGEFVHATTYLHPMVQISKLADPHWTELLVGIRRIQ